MNMAMILIRFLRLLFSPDRDQRVRRMTSDSGSVVGGYTLGLPWEKSNLLLQKYMSATSGDLTPKKKYVNNRGRSLF